MSDRSAPQFLIAVRPPKADYVVRQVESRVTGFSFEDTEAKADKLVLSIDNYDLSQLDSPLWQPGNIVEFSFGYPGAMSPTREMKIQTVKGFNPLQVEALGDETVFNRRMDTRASWENVKRSDVVKQIVAAYGFTAERVHITDTKLIIDRITQGGMTDLQLIKSLAYREGFEFYVDFDGVHFHPRNLGQKPIREFTYFTDRTGDIISVSVEDHRVPGNAGKVTVAGRDPMNKETFKVSADDKSTPRTVLAAERTRYTPDDTKDPRATADLSPALASEFVLETAETTEAAALRHAQGRFQKLDMRSVQITLQVLGDPLVLAKSILRINGLGARFSGLYYVLSAKHDLGAGYVTTLKLRREGLNSAALEGPMKPTTKPTEQKVNTEKQPEPEPETVGREAGAVEVRYVIDERTGEKRAVQTVNYGRSSGTGDAK